MEIVRTTFNDRVNDIEEYFSLVEAVEKSVGNGFGELKVSSSEVYRINPSQQKILYSNIYIKLYNLIESTVLMLINAVERHASQDVGSDVALLSEKMRGLYVKSILAPHENYAPEIRAKKAMSFLNQLLSIEALDIKIPAGNGGNWDSTEIKKLCDRIGVNLILPRPVNTKINRIFKDDHKPIWLIKVTRNNLAHGSISFSECGANHVASELRQLIDIVREYFECVIGAFDNFILSKGYKF